MSSQTEGQHPVLQPEDTSMEHSGKLRRSYTLEFLLSLSELEVCRKLPNGFDESLLSEFEDTSYGSQDRQRVPGSSSVQGFRRTDYGSSLPARGDPVRGINRWDNRSSGRSDTDSDSESGRRYGSQARKSGQNSEHDGLLGSGSFPRPAGYVAAASVPRLRPNGNFHLTKSNEPYHPPRPYKAGPHTRREANDSFNDETFGSTDSTSEDQVEEENKRRAEFELMRKEQHRAFQVKQKSNPAKLEDPFSEIAGLRENVNDGKASNDSDKLLKQVSRDDSGKLPILSQAPSSRPLVPPGFVNSVIDKSSSSKCYVHDDSLEVEKYDMENSHQDVIRLTEVSGPSEMRCEIISSSPLKPEKMVDLSSGNQGTDTVKGPNIPDVSEVFENSKILLLDSEVTEDKLLGKPGHSTSILEKIFGNPVTASSGSPSNFTEAHDAKTDDIWNASTMQSKFAHWFLEEDKKSLGDISSEKPSDLLSFFVGGEKGGSDESNVMSTGPTLALEAMLGHLTSESPHSTPKMSVGFAKGNGPDSKPAVLTCEDLEQSILSEVGGNGSNSRPSDEETSALDVKADAEVDNRASHHLLSLLQRGVGSKGAKSMSLVEEVSFGEGRDHEVGKVNVINDKSTNGNGDGSNGSGNSLTLESLFGTAFMKELHSAQKNSGSARSDVSEPPSLPFSDADAAPFSAMNDFGSGLGFRDGSIIGSNDRITQLNEPRHWSVFKNVEKVSEFSKRPADVDSRFNSIEGGIAARLPEEDVLISGLGNSINAQNFRSSSSSSSSQLPVNVLERLAGFGAALKDERSSIGGQDTSLLHGPYDMAKPELPYHNLHPHASSPHLHAAQMNPGRPLFHDLDSHSPHLDPHLKFMPRDVALHNQLPKNMVPHRPQGPSHHSAGLPGFDQLVHPSILQQQLLMTGSHSSPQLLRGFPGSGTMPPHPSHNPTGYIPDHNPMQGFPYGGQRQPHFSNPRMAPPGAELGGANNPPEAFQRLLEMELRANPKQQMNPFAGGGGGGGHSHSRAMYGHELDMGFQYR